MDTQCLLFTLNQYQPGNDKKCNASEYPIHQILIACNKDITSQNMKYIFDRFISYEFHRKIYENVHIWRKIWKQSPYQKHDVRKLAELSSTVDGNKIVAGIFMTIDWIPRRQTTNSKIPWQNSTPWFISHFKRFYEKMLIHLYTTFKLITMHL